MLVGEPHVENGLSAAALDVQRACPESHDERSGMFRVLMRASISACSKASTAVSSTLATFGPFQGVGRKTKMSQSSCGASVGGLRRTLSRAMLRRARRNARVARSQSACGTRTYA